MTDFYAGQSNRNLYARGVDHYDGWTRWPNVHDGWYRRTRIINGSVASGRLTLRQVEGTELEQFLFATAFGCCDECRLTTCICEDIADVMADYGPDLSFTLDPSGPYVEAIGVYLREGPSAYRAFVDSQEWEGPR